MKKIFTFLVFLCFIGISAAQDFPGPQYKALLGKKITLIEKEVYFNFYVRPKSTELYKESHNSTPKDALFGKVFMVTNFEVNDRGIFFVLSNAETGKLYYKYHKSLGSIYDFKMVDDSFSDEVCSEVVSSVDKFTDEVTKEMNPNNEIIFSKTGSSTYLILRNRSKELFVNKTGVIVLLADGSKIKNDKSEIDVKAGDDFYYDYYAVIKLTNEDLEKLKRSYVTDYRMYILDKHIHSGKISQKLLQCILGQN